MDVLQKSTWRFLLGKVPPKGQTHPLQHGASIFLKTWSRVVSATLGFCQGFDKFVPILEAGLGLPTYSQIKRISGALIWYRTPLRGVDGPPCIAADPVVGCRFWVSGVPLSASVVGYSYYPNRFFLCVCVLFWRLLVYFHIYPSSGAGLKAKDTLQIRKPSLGKKPSNWGTPKMATQHQKQSTPKLFKGISHASSLNFQEERSACGPTPEFLQKRQLCSSFFVVCWS